MQSESPIEMGKEKDRELISIEKFSLKKGKRADFKRIGDIAVPIVVSGEGFVCSKIFLNPAAFNLGLEDLWRWVETSSARKMDCNSQSIFGKNSPRLNYMDGDGFSLVGLGEDEEFVVMVVHLTYSRKID